MRQEGHLDGNFHKYRQKNSKDLLVKSEMFIL